MTIQQGPFIETILILFVILNIFLLGSSRLATLIQLSGIHGIALAILTLALHRGALSGRVLMLALGSGLLKGVVFPLILFRATRVAHIKREIEPLVGYSLSLLLGAVLFGFSWWLGMKLHFSKPLVSPLIVPITFFTIFTGCFLILSRSKAITQVIGYLLLENGIYLFGIAFIGEAPMLVELGVLLDVTVGIFVMQIMIHHISREFESLNVNKLSHLRDWEVLG